MLRRAFRRAEPSLAIEMPADVLEPVLHLHRELRVQRTRDDPIVADRPIAIQPDTGQMNDKHIAGQGGLDVERSGLRITAEDASDPAFIRPTRVDSGRLDGIARP